MPKTLISSRSVRRTARSLLVVCLVGLLVALAGPAGAGRAHFRSSSVELVSDSTAGARIAALTSSDPAALPDILFTFVLVGAGNDGGIFEAAVQEATATFGCVNNGANRPKATNKTTVSMPLSASATLSSDERGNVSGSILLDTGTLFPAGFSCPSGQTVTAIQLELDGITLTELQSGAQVQFDPITAVLWP
jgi:hypothetical protein